MLQRAERDKQRRGQYDGDSEQSPPEAGAQCHVVIRGERALKTTLRLRWTEPRLADALLAVDPCTKKSTSQFETCLFCSSCCRLLVARVLSDVWRHVDFCLRNRKERLLRWNTDRQPLARTDQIRPPVTLERQLQASFTRDCRENAGLCQANRRIRRKAGPDAQAVVLSHRFRQPIELRQRLCANQNDFAEADDVNVLVTSRVAIFRRIGSIDCSGDRPDPARVSWAVVRNVSSRCWIERCDNAVWSCRGGHLISPAQRLR